jgi:Spy/CpxP family protein refolding chaperone
MKKRVLIPLVFLAVVAMVIFVSQHSIQAQAPGGPGGPGGAGGAGGASRAMMMQMFSPDNQWGYISFELGVKDDVLIKCRPAFLEAHTKALAMRTKMGEANGDTDKMRALKTESDSIKSTLDGKLKTILTPEQITKIATWEKETRAKMQQRAAGGGPGGQPGGNQQRRGN